MRHTLFQLLAEKTPIRPEATAPDAQLDDPNELDKDNRLLLDDLQNNILSGHHKDTAHYIFLNFHDGEVEQAKYLLGMLARSSVERTMVLRALGEPDSLEELRTGPLKQRLQARKGTGPFLIDADDYNEIRDMRLVSEREMRRARERGLEPDAQEFVLSLMLSHSGYEKLQEDAPDDPAFREGMWERRAKLNDTWPDGAEKRYGVDAVLIIAFDSTPDREARAKVFERVVSRLADVDHTDVGRVLRNRIKREHDDRTSAIEPFGFVDGVSQPRFYRDARNTPTVPLDTVLVPDPNGRTRYASGTYFAFRKLKQNVQRFYDQAGEIAVATKRSVDQVLAELVGRQRNGDPLVPGGSGVDEFDYSTDPKGLKCPFHAHVRRVNPRSDVGDSERRSLVRRGMPYGPCLVREADGRPALSADNQVQWEGEGEGKGNGGGAPGEVGLLFLCAQADIGRQFEHIQATWANNVQFPWGKMTGADVLTGSLPAGQTNRIRSIHRNPADDSTYTVGLDTAWEPVVEFQGGEYFFAPSIGFLRGLLDDLLKQ